MKTKSLILIASLFFAFFSYAQPQKGTWSIGGSGYRVKTRSTLENKRILFDYNAETQNFIFNHLAVGCNINYAGGQELDVVFKPRYHGFYVAPTLEAYMLNRPTWGLSAKGLVKIHISGSGNFLKFETIPSYMFGPKLSWNITSNLSLYSWVAYRKLIHRGDNYPGWAATVPSDNLDIRWGFSYYLHPKRKEKIRSSP